MIGLTWSNPNLKCGKCGVPSVWTCLIADPFYEDEEEVEEEYDETEDAHHEGYSQDITKLEANNNTAEDKALLGDNHGDSDGKEQKYSKKLKPKNSRIWNVQFARISFATDRLSTVKNGRVG